MDGKKKIHNSYCIDYVSLVFIVGGVDDVEGFSRGPVSLKMRGGSRWLTAYIWMAQQVDIKKGCGQKMDKKWRL